MGSWTTSLCLCALFAPIDALLPTSLPVFYISMDSDDRHILHNVLGWQATKPRRVAGVTAEELPARLVGLDGSRFNPDLPDMRQIAVLVSHLEAMRLIGQELRSDANEDALALVVQDDASLHFAHIWQQRGLMLDDFVHAAPSDWQMVQLATTGHWELLDRWPLEVPPPRLLMRWAGSPAGMGCYAVRASTARYFARAFRAPTGRWDVLSFLADAQRRVAVMTPLVELFFFSRAVTYASLASPMAYTLEGARAAKGRTHETVQHQLCAQEILGYRWRLWSARNASTRVPARRAQEGTSPQHTFVSSRQIVRHLIARERVTTCTATEVRFKHADDSREHLLQHLSKTFNGSVMRFQPGRGLFRQADKKRRLLAA